MALKAKPAGIFLVIVTGIIVIVLAGFFWFQSNPTAALKIAFAPSEPYTPISTEPLDYTDDTNWVALPSMDTFAKAKPAGVMDHTAISGVDVFFVHPTTYLSRDSWNAPLDHADANMRIEKRVLKMQASAFNLAGNIYAPKYRQATFGAFFDEEGNGLQALIYAYKDVQDAFDQFIQDRNEGRPFIVAGHSQGSLHMLSLLKSRIAGTSLADRMVAAYVIGWPVSIEADLDALDGINACDSADDTGCVVSHQTFGPSGDTSGLQRYFRVTNGLGGMPRQGTKMLCTNPLTWITDDTAESSMNIGAVTVVEDESPIGEPVGNFNGAKCGEDGFLYLTKEPGEAWQDYKMFGENYHVYDYHMFYMNIRENAAIRAQAWLNQNR
ncbi:DUF3089 domain-containing protein [Kordiimonas aquimaris]|uniref:DUF3089 domain-containing protein n=1 Tax=Kordiimonas aquimaris TaxID=707591 RepID=UPI0021D1CEC5|nr:DUF3089 domain-containing protein [Kordiimonas aquimaris]